MGSKAEPGKHDCYANAELDEPMFVLLARDPVAPWLVRAWRALRDGDNIAASALMNEASQAFRASGKKALPRPSEKSQEAEAVAAMITWRQRNRGAG